MKPHLEARTPSVSGTLFWLPVMAVALGCSTPSTPGTSGTARERMERTRDILLNAPSAQWDVHLEVEKGFGVSGPPGLYCGVLQGREHLEMETFGRLFAPGTIRYRFQVRGPGRVHWKEEREVAGTVHWGEAWYEGFTLCLRTSDHPDDLHCLEFGEGEGECVRAAMIYGGLIPWQLAHLFPGAFVPGEASVVGEDRVGGRPAIVIEHEFKLGGICQVWERFPGCRVWVDLERGLPLRREYKLRFELEGGDAVLVARETYANWTLDVDLPDSTFHTDGMPPPYALADAPRDPEAFEKMQTEKALGIPVRAFPGPQGPTGYDDLDGSAGGCAFTAEERKPTGPVPPPWWAEIDRIRHPVSDGGGVPEAALARPELDKEFSRVDARGPDGTVFVAHSGRLEEIAPGSGFRSTYETRRHRDSPPYQYDDDVVVSMGTGTGPEPVLFFRDVGSHAYRPHHLAIDGQGRCHLTVADVDIARENRFKLYWVIGDPRARRWTDAWIVDHRTDFTYSAEVWSIGWRDEVHVVWQWSGGDESRHSGIYHVEWTPRGFSRKVRIVRGPGDLVDGTEPPGLAMAVDPESGRLLLACCTGEGIFIASRPAGGPWTRPAALDRTPGRYRTAVVEAAPAGRFMVRAARGLPDEDPREWLVTPEE